MSQTAPRKKNNWELHPPWQPSLITARNLTNQSQSPELIPVEIRKNTVSFDAHRLWAGWGTVSWWCGEMVWRVSNKSLNGLSQHTKYLLTAQSFASKHNGRQNGSESVGRRVSYAGGDCCPASSSRWGPDYGSALPLRSLQGSGLMAGLAPGSTWEYLLWSQTPSQQPCPGQAGSTPRLAAGSARPPRACNQPRWDLKRLEFHSLNLPVSPACTCI